jgi:hypothetical protein
MISGFAACLLPEEIPRAAKSTPSLPSNFAGNRSQLVATDLAQNLAVSLDQFAADCNHGAS